MRTPSLRRTTVQLGVAAFSLLMVAFAAVVYAVIAVTLNSSLGDVLDTRLAIAVDIAEQEPPEAAARHLTSLGVPVRIRPPGGEAVAGEPLSPLLAGLPPGRAGLPEPVIGRSAELDDGTVVEVFASRSGIERTLRWLLGILLLGVVIGVAGAYGLLRRLVGQTMAPLSQVAETAESISRGEHHRRLEPDDARTELGRMATSFDRMLDSLEDAIAEAEEEKQRTHRFLADAAHQLRTPIAGVRASVELLLREAEPHRRDRLLANTVRETVRAGDVVSSLLHMARLDQGRPMDRSAVELDGLVAGELERVRARAPDLAIAQESDGEGPLMVEVDEEEIAQALGNLLDNARRHAQHAIRVLLESSAEDVRVRIVDDGPGVEPGSEELVFERFATLDGKGGSGLGLPIARGVARAHGGELTYERGGFVLRLPRAAV